MTIRRVFPVLRRLAGMGAVVQKAHQKSLGILNLESTVRWVSSTSPSDPSSRVADVERLCSTIAVHNTMDQWTVGRFFFRIFCVIPIIQLFPFL